METTEVKKANEVTAQEYFDTMKSKKNTVTDETLKNIYANCLELANKYKTTGQVRGLRKILFCMDSIEKEKQLVDMGINTFIYKDDIDFYIDNVPDKRPVKIIEMERYEREIPDEIVDVISKTKDIFDQMYIVYTDYTGREERKIEAEKKTKDPILFGTFQSKEYKVCVDRFYYLGDWVDEYCDLTLDKLVNETAKLGRNIVRTISTPEEVAQLKEYIDTHYEMETDSITSFKRKPDKEVKKQGVFSKIKTVFMGKE